MRKWFLFEHHTNAPLRDGKPQRGLIAAHLADDEQEQLSCGTADVKLLVDAQAPSGFIVACVTCLAISECPQ